MKIKNLKKINFFLILLSLSYIYTQDSISTRNDPPELNFISNKAFDEDTSITFTVSAIDSDFDDLTYSCFGSENIFCQVQNDNINLTSTLNFNGVENISIFVNDSNGGQDSQNVEITVYPIDDAPQSSSLSITINEDEQYVFQMPVADVDEEFLSYSVLSNPSNGTVFFNQSNLNYTPNYNFNGNDYFTYSVSDGNSSVTSDVSIEVISINDPPLIVLEIEDINNFYEDDLSYNNINFNDIFYDPEDGTNLSYSYQIDSSLENIISLNISNSQLIIEFEPHRYGSGNITLIASDSGGLNSQDIFFININPVNDPPYIVNIPSPDTTIELGEVYQWLIDPTGTDVDDTRFDISMHTNPNTGSGSIDINTEVNELFEFSWIPENVGINNLAITITDRNSTNAENGPQSAIYSWTVNVVQENNNTPPVIVSLNDATIDEDTFYEISLDISDAESNNIQNFTLNVYDEYLGHVSSNTTTESFYQNGQWFLKVIPEENWNGEMNIILTVSDGSNTTIEDFNLTVNSINDPPEISFNILELPLDNELFYEDSSYSYSLQIYDVDAEYYYNGANSNETITFDISNSSVISASLENLSINYVDEGLFSDSDDINIINFIPVDDYYGLQTFDLIITDSYGESDSATILIEVTNVNDPPIFSPELVNQVYDEDSQSQEYLVYAIDNADYQDPNSIFIYSCESSLNINCAIEESAIIFSNSTEHFNGNEEINISVNDGEGGVFNGTITVTVNSVNDPPYANDILISTEEDQDITYNFSSDDVDDYIGLDTDNGAMTYSIIDNPLNGNVINNDNGSFTYTPNENYYGQDTFTFIAIDDENLSSENVALVTINVNEYNDAPFLDNILDFSFSEDSDTTITIIASDIENDNLIYNITGGDSILTEVNGNFITFTPNENWNGTETFSISVSDGFNPNVIQDNIQITVLPVNDSPEAINQSLTTDEDEQIEIQLTGFDIENDNLTFLINLDSNNGIIDDSNIPFITYTPNENYYGSDSFEFSVFDGEFFSIGEVEILVESVNDIPFSNPITAEVNEDQSIVIALLGDDIETQISLLNYNLEEDANNGLCENNNDGTITYTPNENFPYNNSIIGNDQCAYSVNDGESNSNISIISLNINPINDSPVTIDSSNIAYEDGGVISGELSYQDADIDDSIEFNLLDSLSSNELGILNFNDNGSYTYDIQSFYQYLGQGDSTKIDFIFNAIDDSLSSSDSSKVEITIIGVNDLPFLDISNVPFLVDEDSGFDLNIFENILNATDIDNSIEELIYSCDLLQDSKIDCEINNESDILKLATTVEHFNGDSQVIIQVTDQIGDLVSDTLNITILPIADPPEVLSEILDSFNDDISKTIKIDFFDPDGQSQDNFLVTLNDTIGAGFWLNNLGEVVLESVNNYSFEITGTPSDEFFQYCNENINEQKFECELHARIEDIQDGFIVDKILYLDIVDDNDLPIIQNIEPDFIENVDISFDYVNFIEQDSSYNLSIFEDSEGLFDLYGFDADDDSITFFLSDNPCGDNQNLSLEVIDNSVLKIVSMIENFNNESENYSEIECILNFEDGREPSPESQKLIINIFPVNDAPNIVMDNSFNDWIIQDQNLIVYEIDEGADILESDSSKQVIALPFYLYDIDTQVSQLELTDNLNVELTNPYANDLWFQENYILEISNFDTLNSVECDTLTAPICYPMELSIKIDKDYNGEIFINFSVNDNDTTSYYENSYNLDSEVLSSKIIINQVDDPIESFEIYYPLDNFDEYDIFYSDDQTMFFRENDSLYLKFSQNIDANNNDYLINVIGENNGAYTYQNFLPNEQEYFFKWSQSSDVDTNPELNFNPEKIFYRLELIDDNNVYIIKENILDINNCNGEYCSTSIIFNNNLNLFSHYQINNDECLDDSTCEIKNLNFNGSLEYKWRIAASNNSNYILENLQDDVITLEDDAFFIDLNYPTGEFYFTLNQIYYDHFNMYFLHDSDSADSVSGLNDSVFINYRNNIYQSIDDILEFDKMENENIFYLNSNFDRYSEIDFFIFTTDKRENIYINRSSVNYQYILPNEISSYYSPSNLLLIEVDGKNLYNQSTLLIYETEIKENYPELIDYNILSNEIKILTNGQILNPNYKIKVDLRNLDAQINPNSIKIVSVENDDLNILHGMKLGDFMVFDVDKLNSYFIINNSDDYIDEVNPLKFGINSCYPNPFNPIVNIDYSIEQNSEVVVSIYDIRGNRVNILDKGYKFSGENHVSWNGRDFNGEIVSSGVYFVEIKNSSFKDVKKITLLK